MRRASRPARATLAVLIAVLLLGGCARNEARPEGIAERWLHAVSDSGREGLLADADERMRQHGDPTLAPRILPTDRAPDERTFSDLEVGQARITDATARVPFRATARIEGDQRRELSGTAVLVKTGGHWRVADLQPRADGERVPSEGGDRPAGANAAHWVVALLLALAMTAASIALIERQPGAHPAPQG